MQSYLQHEIFLEGLATLSRMKSYIHQQVLNPSPDPTYIYLNVDINQDLPQHRLLGQDLLQREHVHQQVFNPSPGPTYIHLNVNLNQDLPQHRLFNQNLLQSETSPLVNIS